MSLVGQKIDRYSAMGNLWIISNKLKGIGEIMGMAGGEPPASELALLGISSILLDLAGEIDQIRDVLEEEPGGQAHVDLTHEVDNTLTVVKKSKNKKSRPLK